MAKELIPVQKCCPMPFVLRDEIFFQSQPTDESFILLESGDYLLQEDNSKFKLETSI